MFYWLYEHFSAGGHGHVTVLNLIRYLTFRTMMSILTSQVIVVAMGSRFIRWMQAKQGKGQPIRAEGIQRHVIEKAGTPTMGGVMILAGLLIGTLLWADLSNPNVWCVILVTAGYGLMLAILGLLVEDTIQRLNALKSYLSLTVNLVGAVLFAIVAPVHWPAVAVMVPASLLGGRTGAIVARHIPADWLRGGVAVIGITVAESSRRGRIYTAAPHGGSRTTGTRWTRSGTPRRRGTGRRPPACWPTTGPACNWTGRRPPCTRSWTGSPPRSARRTPSLRCWPRRMSWQRDH